MAILKNFPKYVLGWFAGTLIALMSDPTITALALGCVALGFLIHSVLLGVTAFLILFACFRVINSVANAIGFGLQGVAMRISPPAPQPPMDPAMSSAHPVDQPRLTVVAPSALEGNHSAVL